MGFTLCFCVVHYVHVVYRCVEFVCSVHSLEFTMVFYIFVYIWLVDVNIPQTIC